MPVVSRVPELLTLSGTAPGEFSPHALGASATSRSVCLVSDRFPAVQDTEQERRAHLFSEICFGRGWSRTLPAAAVVVMAVLTNEGPLTRAQLDEQLRPEVAGGRQGLDAPAWDPLVEYTEEELAAQRESFAGTAFELDDEEESRSAAEVTADEAARRQEHLAEMDSYSDALGVAPVCTLGQLVDLMAACRVLTVDDAQRYVMNPAAPLPGEVLPLGAEESERQDQLRWSDLHSRTAQSVIKLFQPDAADRIDRIRTSLQKLARHAGADVESVRGAVVNLLEEGDFSASLDVTTAADHQVFELSVEWENFVRSRISIRYAGPGEDPSVSAWS